jgi:hypothetical protein
MPTTCSTSRMTKHTMLATTSSPLRVPMASTCLFSTVCG